MFGYIYLTTNLINNHKYIGQKKAKTFLGDKYFGSGKILKEAISKYGKENFKVEILKECETKEELDTQEQYYIKLFNAQENREYYNICKGGEAGPGGPMFKGHHHNKETRNKMSMSRKGENNSNFGNHWTDEQKQKLSEKRKQNGKSAGKNNPNYGKQGKDSPNYQRKFSDERNQKIAKARKELTYITNGILNKAVRKTNLQQYIENGWWVGRISRKKYPLKEGATTIESTY